MASLKTPCDGGMETSKSGDWSGGKRGGWGGGHGGKGGDRWVKGGHSGYRGGGRGGQRGSYRGGYRKITPKLDMTPVGGIADHNVFWAACEKERLQRKKEEEAAVLLKPCEEPPFVFEPPETDFHIQSTELLKELMQERSQNGLTDRNGSTIGLCAHTHGEVCRFCDGRRGPWVKNGLKADPAFRRYQDSILASIPGASSSASLRSAGKKLNTLRLVPEDELTELADELEDLTVDADADEVV